MSALDPWLGNFIAGCFTRPPAGASFQSHDPATARGDVVFEAMSDPTAVDAAVSAAEQAWQAWRRLGFDGRLAALERVRALLPAHAERLAEAITNEMGKPIAEARAEVGLLGNKIDEMRRIVPHELGPAVAGAPGEQRFAPLGPTAIVGPFNFPLHLVHTHLVPVLLTGNTVIAKPSELTPLAGQRYAELFAAAELPAGVFNLVQGTGDVGGTLVAHPRVRCVVFTGGIDTGRRIRLATFDQPWKKLCLELGGKNPAIVLDDADLDQAVRELLLGALLTTGQRCTATSRVIATPGIADALRDALTDALGRIRPGDPRRDTTFLGPLASHSARARYLARLTAAKAEAAEVILDGESQPDGAFVTPSLLRAAGTESFLTEELFGPSLAFEVARDEADALDRIAGGPFGLSASVFSADPTAFERFVDQAPFGILNWNRSTNGASGALPFGGLGASGNFNPGGSMAPRLATVPTAVMRQPLGARTANTQLDAALRGTL